MRVLKSSGDVENFCSKKIYYSIREAGGSKKLATESVRGIEKKYHRGMTTKEILLILLKLLKKEPGVSERYDLKRAIMSLGPSGFPFEDYFSRILNYYDYETKTGNKLHGTKIYHEVDIVAKKNNKKWMVECKYHNESGTVTRLKPAMYTYARFLDLKRQKFDSPWLVTNTKCSVDAVRYARGVELRITSWKYPKKESLQDLIKKKNLYPITIIKSLNGVAKERLFSLKILVAKDLLNFTVEQLEERTGLTESESIKVLEEVKAICG